MAIPTQLTTSSGDSGGSLLERFYEQAETLQLPDGPIRILRAGRGPAIVLVHGAPLSMLSWRHNLEELSHDFTVVALDLKGFGGSHKRPGDYSPAGHAAVLREVISELELDEVALVGHSYGCAPAVSLALSQPAAVRRLVLVNSVGYPGGRHTWEQLLRIGLVSAGLRTALRSSSLAGAVFRRRFDKAYETTRPPERGLMRAYLAFLQEPGAAEAFVATLREFDEKELALRFPEVSQPTLIVWGDSDRILPVRNAERISQRIPNAQLLVIPDCGHVPQESASEQFNTALRSFLGRCSAPSE